MLAEIAELRDEERSKDLLARHGRRRKAVASAIRRVDEHFTLDVVPSGSRRLDDVTLDPGPEITGRLRHVVLHLAGIDAQAAADAAINVDAHEPFVLGWVV